MENFNKEDIRDWNKVKNFHPSNISDGIYSIIDNNSGITFDKRSIQFFYAKNKSMFKTLKFKMTEEYDKIKIYSSLNLRLEFYKDSKLLGHVPLLEYSYIIGQV